jgi:hypothetical protein
VGVPGRDGDREELSPIRTTRATRARASVCSRRGCWVRETDGWRPFIYKWDEAQTEALALRRGYAGSRVSWIDEEGATRAHQYPDPEPR